MEHMRNVIVNTTFQTNMNTKKVKAASAYEMFLISIMLIKCVTSHFCNFSTQLKEKQAIFYESQEIIYKITQPFLSIMGLYSFIFFYRQSSSNSWVLFYFYFFEWKSFNRIDSKQKESFIRFAHLFPGNYCVHVKSMKIYFI